MASRLDFASVNHAALGSLESLCMEWFPAGKKDGHEFRVGSLNGEPGSSLSVNLTTGRWADFAGDAKGSDPIEPPRRHPQLQAGRGRPRGSPSVSVSAT